MAGGNDHFAQRADQQLDCNERTVVPLNACTQEADDVGVVQRGVRPQLVDPLLHVKVRLRQLKVIPLEDHAGAQPRCMQHSGKRAAIQLLTDVKIVARD